MEMTRPHALSAEVFDRLAPLADELLREQGPRVHSFHVVGSAAMADYDAGRSDINTLLVLHAMDLSVVEFLAPLGKKYGKRGIAAPLVMTPEYIRSSLDAFSIEFHDFALIHATLLGEDILRGLPISRQHLRLQCEREIKVKLIGLRQGYLATLGRKQALSALLISSITGSMALFRAVIALLGAEPPAARNAVLDALAAAGNRDTAAFQQLLQLKSGSIAPTDAELRVLFEHYHGALEALGSLINELHA